MLEKLFIEPLQYWTMYLTPLFIAMVFIVGLIVGMRIARKECDLYDKLLTIGKSVGANAVLVVISFFMPILFFLAVPYMVFHAGALPGFIMASAVKNKKAQHIILVVVALLIFYMPVFGRMRHAYTPAPLAFKGESTNLALTTMVPTLDTPVPPKQNVIWCASFNAAWAQLRELAGEEVRIAGAEDVCTRLNAYPDPKSIIPGDALYATAGFVDEGIIPTIHENVAEKFPDHPLPDFSTALPDSFLAYALLKTQLKFPKPYYDTKALAFTGSDGKPCRVSAFGIDAYAPHSIYALRRQVQVLHRAEGEQPEQFIVDLWRDSRPLQLVLALIPPAETLEETYQRAQERIKNAPPSNDRFEDLDELKVPNIAFQIVHRFAELEGKRFDNESLRKQPVDRAQQDILFRLDRSGAELTAESRMIAESAVMMPTHYHFNRPFLLYMKLRDAEEPFFVLWVDNGELLDRWEE